MNKIKSFLFHSAVMLIAIPIASIIAAAPTSLVICILKEWVYDIILFGDGEFTFEIQSFHLMLSRMIMTALAFAYLMLITKYNKQFRQWLNKGR